jgi:hypothetical protein
MIVYFQFIMLLSAINLLGTVNSLSMPYIPVSDVIIDIDKAFVLQRMGTYSSKLKEEIVHTFVPLDNLCATAPGINICLFVNHTTHTNELELATILSPREILTVLPRYDDDQISNFIGNDISRIHRAHPRNEFIMKKNSVVHLINGQFHSTNGIKNSLHDSTKSLVDSNESNIPRLSPPAPTIILRQINNNKIGFDFLTDAELISFLTATIATIDTSYQITDLSESLNLFSQLIVAQSIYILRSCSIQQEQISTSQSCLIVSTLFLRPSIESNTVFSVYRLIPLPAVVNGEQFMYANMPEVIGVNTDDQTVILWDSAPKKKECLFSIFVYCKEKPPLVQLSDSPCLSELFNYDTHIVSSCQITRSRGMQTNIINIDSNIWLFS